MRDSFYDYMVYTSKYFISFKFILKNLNEATYHMTFKFPRYIQENLGVSYTKTQQPPRPPNNIIWSAYIITTNTEALYFDFQGMPITSHSALVFQEIAITLQ